MYSQTVLKKEEEEGKGRGRGGEEGRKAEEKKRKKEKERERKGWRRMGGGWKALWVFAWAKYYLLTFLPRSTRVFSFPSFTISWIMFILYLFFWPPPSPIWLIYLGELAEIQSLGCCQKFLSYGFLLIVSAEFPLIAEKLHYQHTP